MGLLNFIYIQRIIISPKINYSLQFSVILYLLQIQMKKAMQNLPELILNELFQLNRNNLQISQLGYNAMNQIVMEERKGFLGRMGKIGKTNELLDQLENKMNGYFGRKKTEDHLLNSENQTDLIQEPIKPKSTFKLFSKVTSNPMKVEELNTTTPQRNLHQPSVSGIEEVDAQKLEKTSELGQLISEVEAIDTLVRKKLKLKEERISQLESQLQIQHEEKVHLYKINCQLEEELAEMQKRQQMQAKKIAEEEKQLERELARLKKIHESKVAENKKTNKQVEVLKDSFRNAQKARKGYIEVQFKNSLSKPKIIPTCKKDHNEEHYLRGLVVELDKLRNMVKDKMKKSVSKSRIK